MLPTSVQPVVLAQHLVSVSVAGARSAVRASSAVLVPRVIQTPISVFVCHSLWATQTSSACSVSRMCFINVIKKTKAKFIYCSKSKTDTKYEYISSLKIIIHIYTKIKIITVGTR